jgi:hypothetical protein
MSTRNPYLDIDRQILADAFSSDETRKILLFLCDDIGPRFAGTEGYRRAADYVKEKFEEYTLDKAVLEPFRFTGWQRGAPSALAMVTPVVRQYPSYALPYGAPTGSRGVTAPMIDIGPGAKADVVRHRKQIRGRIVFTSATGAHRSEIYGRCTDAGAVGFIMVNGADGMLLPTGCVKFGDKGTIPAVGIPHESGLQIQRFAMSAAPVLKLVTSDRFSPGKSCNVLGELAGTTYPDELVVIGGHLDSHDLAPGAMDNAAGSTVVVETARLLARQRSHLKRTVRFIAFGAEEIGLLGSYHHVKLHASEMRNVRLMLNVDCPPMSRPKGLVFHKWPGAKEFVESLGRQMETDLPFGEGIHQHSDHFPFVLKGVPTAEMCGGRFSPAVNSFGHMAGDTADKVSITDLSEGAAFLARVLLRAANDDAWPFGNRSPREVDMLLKEAGIREAIRFEGQPGTGRRAPR